MTGVHLVLTAADVGHLGDVPCLAPMDNPTARRSHMADIPVLPATSPSTSATRSPSWSPIPCAQARDAAEAIESTTSRCRRSRDCARRWRRAPRRCGPRQRTTSPTITAWATRPTVDARLRKGATGSSRSTVENNRLDHQLHGDARRRRANGTKRSSFTLTSGARASTACATRSPTGSSRCRRTRCRCITGDVGGGFGTKTFMYREYPLAAEAARRLGRPVKWFADRTEHFRATRRAATTSPSAKWPSTARPSSWRCASTSSAISAPICRSSGRTSRISARR